MNKFCIKISVVRWLEAHLFSCIIILIGIASVFSNPSSLYNTYIYKEQIFILIGAVTIMLVLFIVSNGSPFRCYPEKYVPAYIIFYTMILNIWIFFDSNVDYIIDDGFYYLEIARNISRLGWSTFDEIVTTNGYHPFWMFILVVTERICQLINPDNLMIFVRGAQILQILFLGMAISLIYLHLLRVCDRFTSIILSLGFLAFPLTPFVMLLGLETSLVFLLLLWSHFIITSEKPKIFWFLLSIGFIIITRVEIGLLWAFICFFYIVLMNYKKGIPFFKYRILLILFIATSLTSLAATFAYNYLITEELVSYAGVIKKGWANRQFMEFMNFPFLEKVHALFQAIISQTFFESPFFLLEKMKIFHQVDRTKITIWTIFTLLTLLVYIFFVATQWHKLKKFFIRTKLWLFVGFGISLTLIYKILLFAHTGSLLGGPDYQSYYYHFSFHTIGYLSIIAPVASFCFDNHRKINVTPPLLILILAIGLMGQLFFISDIFQPLYSKPSYKLILEAVSEGIPVDKVWHPNGGQVGFALNNNGVSTINGDGLVNNRVYIERTRKDGEIAPYLRDKGCDYFLGIYNNPNGWFNQYIPVPIVKNEADAYIVHTHGYFALYKLLPENYVMDQFNVSKNVLLAFDQLKEPLQMIIGESLEMLPFEQGKSDGIRFISKNDDPVIILPWVSWIKGNTAILKIEITSPDDTKLQIYYMTNSESDYSEKNCLVRSLKKGYNDIYIALPFPGLAGQLRMDIGSIQGDYILHNLELRSVNDLVLKN